MTEADPELLENEDVTVNVAYSIGSANFSDAFNHPSGEWSELDYDGRRALVEEYVNEKIQNDLTLSWTVDDSEEVEGDEEE